ncbi:hypothetical protein LTR51_008676 [Lithohypha guttulata]|nr:hypothetical protein LTR51_008676 [Lithohypha guttulata]
MDTLLDSMRERMPEDLYKYLKKQKSIPDITVREKKPANVVVEVIQIGTSQVKVYFPASSSGNMVVFVHFPGGICKRGINRDQSWCSNLAQDSGSIYVAVDYPCAPQDSFRQILLECQSTLEQVRQLCQGRWKEKWDTDSNRIVLSGSSIGATLAIIVAGIAARNNEPVYGLIALVPLIDTNPNLTDDPWGDNENTTGLTPDRLLSDLNAAFQNDDPRVRDHWHSNLRYMPNEVMRSLPRIFMVLAKLDILYRSQLEFKTRLQDQHADLSCIEVNGLHQVKDLDCVTETAREVRRYIWQASKEFMVSAACSANRGPAVVPELRREEATERLCPYDVRRLTEL